MRPEHFGLQFHSSELDEDEFMRAPALHIGTKNAATEIGRNQQRRIYPLRFSDHTQFHDEVLEDDVANEAHAQFLEGHGLTVPLTVNSSRLTVPRPGSGEDYHGKLTKAGAAADSLRQNKVLRYINSAEDSGSTSHIVPTPHMNVYRWPNRDPQAQPVLPMDFSGIDPSERTRKDREQRGRNVT